ncbi:MAG: hypothetical protein ACOCYT_01540, partial [Chloroflexota bacterium]
MRYHSLITGVIAVTEVPGTRVGHIILAVIGEGKLQTFSRTAEAHIGQTGEIALVDRHLLR